LLKFELRRLKKLKIVEMASHIEQYQQKLTLINANISFELFRQQPDFAKFTTESNQVAI
jgi:hypothetical protein